MKQLISGLIVLNAKILKILPVQLRFFLGDLIGWLWFDVLRVRRVVVLDNLKIAFPDWTRQQRIKVGRQSVCNLGRGLIEVLTLPALSRENLNDKELFKVEGEHYLTEALEKGRGAFLLTLHLGNGDMAIAGLALHDIPLTVVSKIFKVQWLNDFWFNVRSRLGTEFIPPRNSSYEILKALKKKKTIGFVLDQFMGPPIGVRTQFFGKETGTAMGLAVMVKRSKAPVVPIYFYREDDGTTVIRFEKEIPFEEKESKDETIRHMTQTYTDKIESIVRLYPEQWMWVHKRWKEFRD